MKLIALSDTVLENIYSPAVKDRFADVDLVVSCGDLSYAYLEFVVDMLDKPLFFVRGNHDKLEESTETGPRSAPWGGQDLHGKSVMIDNVILVGFEGCLRYKPGPFQYSQFEMWGQVFKMIPRLILNKIRFGRYLDILVTHAPSWGILDKPDLAHQGFKAFAWVLEKFRPKLHLHGHVHTYTGNQEISIQVGPTRVVNVWGVHSEELLAVKADE